MEVNLRFFLFWVCRMSKRENFYHYFLISNRQRNNSIEREGEKGDSNDLLMSFYFVISEAEHIDVMGEARRRK